MPSELAIGGDKRHEFAVADRDSCSFWSRACWVLRPLKAKIHHPDLESVRGLSTGRSINKDLYPSDFYLPMAYSLQQHAPDENSRV